MDAPSEALEEFLVTELFTLLKLGPDVRWLWNGHHFSLILPGDTRWDQAQYQFTRSPLVRITDASQTSSAHSPEGTSSGLSFDPS